MKFENSIFDLIFFLNFKFFPKKITSIIFFLSLEIIINIMMTMFIELIYDHHHYPILKFFKKKFFKKIYHSKCNYYSRNIATENKWRPSTINILIKTTSRKYIDWLSLIRFEKEKIHLMTTTVLKLFKKN